MKHKPQRRPDVSKATTYAIVVNAIQIAVLFAFVAYILLFSSERGNPSLIFIVTLGAIMAAWGASIDIADALQTRRRRAGFRRRGTVQPAGNAGVRRGHGLSGTRL